MAVFEKRSLLGYKAVRCGSILYFMKHTVNQSALTCAVAREFSQENSITREGMLASHMR